MLARNLTQTLVKSASNFHRSRAEPWLVARNEVSLAQQPPTSNHSVADELGSHRVEEMAGQIFRGQWRCGAVVRKNQIGGSSCFEHAELYTETLRGEPCGLAKHFKRPTKWDGQGGVVAFEFGDASLAPHIGADPVGAELRWLRELHDRCVSDAVVHVRRGIVGK